MRRGWGVPDYSLPRYNSRLVFVDKGCVRSPGSTGEPELACLSRRCCKELLLLLLFVSVHDSIPSFDSVAHVRPIGGVINTFL